jgi:hypothetical protein
VEEVDVIPVQHVLNAWHKYQADALAVSVARRAYVPVIAADHFVAPSLAPGAGRFGINPRRLASSWASDRVEQGIHDEAVDRDHPGHAFA